MKKHKRMLATMFVAIMFLTSTLGDCIPGGGVTDTYGATGTAYGDLLISGGTAGTDYSYDEGSDLITIANEGDYTIIDGEGIDASHAGTTCVLIASGVNVTLHLAGIHISPTTLTAPIKIADDSTGDVEIVLDEGSDNVLRSKGDCPKTSGLTV